MMAAGADVPAGADAPEGAPFPPKSPKRGSPPPRGPDGPEEEAAWEHLPPENLTKVLSYLGASLAAASAATALLSRRSARHAPTPRRRLPSRTRRRAPGPG